MLVTKRYFIRRGDSEALIAVRFGCTREDLLNANPGPHVVTDRYGSRGFYPGWFVPGRRINVPIVGSSGAVSGPSGAVGFQIPRMREINLFPQNQQVAPQWNDNRPDWGGSYIAHWSQRVIIQAQRYQLPGVNTLTTLPFLRSFSSPVAFRDAMRQAQVAPGGYAFMPPKTLPPDNSTWYAEPMDQFVAYAAAKKISNMVSALGAMSGPSGTVGGTCGPIENKWGTPNQCVHSEYDVNLSCTNMCQYYVRPYAFGEGFKAGHSDGLRGYNGQYVVPSVPDHLVPYAHTSTPQRPKGVQQRDPLITLYYCNVQAWNAWEPAYIEGYAEGHARGMQERQAAAIAQGAQAIAAMGAKAQRERGVQAIAALAPPGRAPATGYGPFTGRRG